ncbi:MAG TPA: TIGR03013 family XrtA/PEP-CTERM system glycosyltransferase [Thermoanaerobaculia bacterium]|nr:TIGR03013 family XrtA/PEP-CTERM system glycosyltransferase [Thermoanaerobaculia bacterium]
MIRLFSRYWAVPAFLSLVVEAVVLLGALWLATQLRLGVGPGEPPAGRVLAAQMAVFAGVTLFSLYLHGLYDFAERLSDRFATIRLVQALTVAAWALWALFFLVPETQVGRGVFALALGFSSLGLMGWRFLLRFFPSTERVLIVGTDEKAIDIAREILRRSHLGYRIVGFLDDDPALQGVSILNPRVIGTTSQARELALGNGVTRVVVAGSDRRGRMNVDSLLQCKTSGIQVVEGSSYYERMTGKIMIEGLRKSWLIFNDGFVVSRGTRVVKRLLDIVAAVVGLLLAAPIMALVALAVRLGSPGPVLFRQERVGLNGRPFTLWKFRTMRPDAEAEGARWATVRDPRITAVGRFLRATRLDELPQLCNVLFGDMSLVGPRPERAVFVKTLERQVPFYEQRFGVRPGLTGWAQIKAPYASSLEESVEKLKYDLYYVKNLSVLLDLSILASTARIVLLGRGAR